VGGNLDEVVGGVGIGCLEEGDDGFVDAVEFNVGRVERIDDVGEASPRVLEGAMQMDQFGGDGCGLGSTEANDADPTTTRRRGNGGDGVGRDGTG
jgi:hypothetical protein